MAIRPKAFTYTADVSWDGDRRATASADPRPAIAIAPPPDFPGGDDAGWSPEHLFLASLQACTMIAFLNHCDHRRIEVESYRSTGRAEVSRRDEDGRYAILRIETTVMVRVGLGSVDDARALTELAERDCFVAASTTAEVETDWRIIA